MNKGVLYYIGGQRHWDVLITSMWSLRQVYKGEIAIMIADEFGQQIYDMIASDPRLSPVIGIEFEPVKYRKFTGYMNKPRMISESPFDSTIFFDADTVITQPIDDLFPKPDDPVWLTKYSDWLSTGNKMRSRIKKWEHVEPDRVARQLRREWWAINTGVLCFGSGAKSEHFGADWLITTQSNPSFIADEIAAQLIYPDHGCVVLDDRFNCSPIYGVSKEHARVWHFHGKKHTREEALPMWWPAYQDAVTNNIASIKDWTATHDKRLSKYLEEIGDDTN